MSLQWPSIESSTAGSQQNILVGKFKVIIVGPPFVRNLQVGSNFVSPFRQAIHNTFSYNSHLSRRFDHWFLTAELPEFGHFHHNVFQTSY